jgi:GTP 3',8-cyclase
MLLDSYGRKIRDLRLSLTDRCNFRCFYCLPNGEPPLARKDTILSFEEIVEICGIFVSLGIEKIRLTGGEPLLRKNIEVLISELAKLKIQENNSNFLNDLALTTNGHTFPTRAKNLKKLGLNRVTLSLDSLKRDKFKEITGVDALENVLESIEAAKEVGFSPIKINAVIVRDKNDDEITSLAQFALENEVSMRFIEFMPLDSGHEWNRNMVVSGKEIYTKINEQFPLKLKETSRGSETAWKYSFVSGGNGEIGIIAPVTEMFCGQCSRIRLTADGQICTCLFSTTEHNLRDVLRSGASRVEIVKFIENVVLKKEPRHYINDKEFSHASRSMSFIGG